MDTKKKPLIKATMVLATDIFGRIGKENDLIYKDKDDMKVFQSITKNSIIIVGRKTYESFPEKGLDSILSRNNSMIVLSRKSIPALRENIDICPNIGELDKLILEKSKREEKNSIVLAGGSLVYSSAFLQILNGSSVLDVNLEAYISVFKEPVKLEDENFTYISLASLGVESFFTRIELEEKENFILYKLT